MLQKVRKALVTDLRLKGFGLFNLLGDMAFRWRLTLKLLVLVHLFYLGSEVIRTAHFRSFTVSTPADSSSSDFFTDTANAHQVSHIRPFQQLRFRQPGVTCRGLAAFLSAHVSSRLSVVLMPDLPSVSPYFGPMP